MSLTINKIEVTEDSQSILLDFTVPADSNQVLSDIKITYLGLDEPQSIIGFFPNPLGENHVTTLTAADIGSDDLYGIYKFDITLVDVNNLASVTSVISKMVGNLTLMHEVVLDLASYSIETCGTCKKEDLLKISELNTSVFLNSLLTNVYTALYLESHDYAFLLEKTFFEQDCLEDRIEGFEPTLKRIGVIIENNQIIGV